MYGFELWLAKRLGFIKEDEGTYEMTLKVLFIITTTSTFTHCPISTKCGVSCDKKRSPNVLNYKRTDALSSWN